MNTQSHFTLVKGALFAAVCLTLGACNSSSKHEASSTDTTFTVIEETQTLDNPSDVSFDSAASALKKGEWSRVTTHLKAGIAAYKEEAKKEKPDRQGVIDAQIKKMEALVPKAEAKNLNLDELILTTGVAELVTLHRAIEVTEELTAITPENSQHLRQTLADLEKQAEVLPAEAKQEIKKLTSEAHAKLEAYEKAPANNNQKEHQALKEKLSKIREVIHKHL